VLFDGAALFRFTLRKPELVFMYKLSPTITVPLVLEEAYGREFAKLVRAIVRADALPLALASITSLSVPAAEFVVGSADNFFWSFAII